MTEELDALKAALHRVPEADPAAKQDVLNVALENFDRAFAGSQETAPPARPTPASPRKAGFLTGVVDMLKSFSPAGLLAGTTSLAALAVAAVALGLMLREGPPGTPEPATADIAAKRGMPAVVPSVPPEPTQAADAAATGMSSGAQARVPTVEVQTAPALASREQGAPVAGFVADGVIAPAPQDITLPLPADTETFANAEVNPVKTVAEAPVSTFSIDVDTASYTVIRQSLASGHLPPKEAVRIEEMVNYFPYAYPAPEGSQPFRADVAVMPTPWNTDTRLVRIGLQGRLPALADRPPLNLVFLVDTSGSMDDPAKLPLLKQALRLTLPQLRPEDQVAIVAYAGSAGTVLEPTAASDAAAISVALDRLDAGGSTAGAEGLALAYQVAADMAAPGEVSRVLLATDGDFNLGISDPQALADYVAKQRKSGTYLSVLGFGRGNLDDAVMQALAQNGNGMAAYIDTAQEARKVLVDQLSGALFPLADDVKVQVEWNPAQVAEYRLIGYETRALRREDFNNDKVDAGEIGAGHQVT
ncbi:MAG: von Willebrand factor type A domain-containing protein, partial [Gemmobacter sp.]|nr:von Willebrand factor type A domain-containing protein [Gemmobacter sp.]